MFNMFKRDGKVVEELKLPSAKRDPYELSVGWWLSSINDRLPNQREYWKYSPGSQAMVDKIGPCEDGASALRRFRSRTPLDQISPTIRQGRSWKNIPVRDLSPRFRKIHDNPEKYRSPNFYRRFALGEICGTVTASAQPENAGITHPFENRRFSVREIARIQSFPDEFNLSHRRITAPYKGIGNAVPPVLAWVLANAVARHLGLGPVSGKGRKVKAAGEVSHRRKSPTLFG
jgi:DNA (cytosine-5)-methyltransferase 1